jgi:hypothetical protein
MKVFKNFETTFSHKFPNGEIASMKLGTAIEVDSVLDTASDKDIAKFSDQLAKQVYKLTIRDLKKIIKKDKLAKEIYDGIHNAVKSADDEREAERILEEDDE